MDKLMWSLLDYIAQHSPVKYADVLRAHEATRPCRVSSSLARLKRQGRVDYRQGRYIFIDAGDEE